MLLLPLLVLAVSTHLELVNEVFRIPPGEWRYVELGLKQKPAFVMAEYEVQSGSTVQLLLLRREDLNRLGNERAGAVLAATNRTFAGRMLYQVRVPDDYVIVVDNRDSDGREAKAHLRISLDFNSRPGPQVTRLSRPRQFAVIVISFVVFFAIVGYSARRLLQGMRH
jgi:hypothetical protein